MSNADAQLVEQLISRWHARRAEFERLILNQFNLQRINDILRLGRHTRPLRIPDTTWYCWTHGIGVCVSHEDETGGIDFDFDKPHPDVWRLRIFVECQIEEDCTDASTLQDLIRDKDRFQRACAAAGVG